MASQNLKSVSGFVGRWVVCVELDNKGEKVVKIYHINGGIVR
jgi:hypothetical protein